MTLNEFKDKYYGVKRTKKRDELEERGEKFKLGTPLHRAPLEKGMEQEELAKKIGTTKSNISKRNSPTHFDN